MRIMLLAALAAGAVAVSGCGSQEESALKSAFSHRINSANVSMALDVTTAKGALHATLSGPYKSNGKGRLASLDWKLHFAYGPQALDAELISTGDNAFVKYDGQTYEVGKDTVRKLQERSTREQRSSPLRSFKAADLSQFMRRARSWFPDTSTQQDAQLDGEDVTRVTGRLDLSKAVGDIVQIAAQGQALPQKELRKLDRQVSDPRFTVDVGKADGKLRRILVSLRIRGQGPVRFELQYHDVDKPVTIDAPASGLPLSQLEQKFKQDFGGSSASSGGGSTA